MNILAIESSCDETAAAVVKNGRTVLSSCIASQVEEHIIYGGVVPEIASRRHVEAIVPIARCALDEAGCSFADLDAVAVTAYPGLIGALLVGVNYAKGVSFATGLPLVPVHHLRAHIAANYITHKDLEPPFLCLVVSGGHSHIVHVKGYTSFEVIGRTRDDAAGEVMDKAARALGLPYPGGLNLDIASADGNPDAYKLPRPRVDGREFDFSFSGLKTAAINIIHNAAQKGESVSVADFGASFIRAVVDCLAENTIAAAAYSGCKTVVLAGGVAANSRLRARFVSVCEQLGLRLYLPETHLCGDNAAMVGAQAYYEYLAGNTADMSLNARASAPIEG